VLFANEKVFPLTLGQLMAVGERTSNMDEMLTSVAKYYEEEFTTFVDGVSTIIEPLMIVLVRAMIWTIVVALYPAYFFGRRRHPVTARAKNALDSQRQNWRDCSPDISEQKIL
jgi:hypothetical protein